MAWIGPTIGAIGGYLSSRNSGGGSSTSTVSNDPWSGVQPYLRMAYGDLAALNEQVPQYYDGQLVAGFSQDTLTGMDYTRALAGQMPGQINSLFGAQQQVMTPEMLQGLPPELQQYFVQGPDGSYNQYMDPSQINALTPQLNASAVPDINPYLEASATGAMAPVKEQLLQEILPSIDLGAVASGGFSSSRRDLATANAVDKATQTMSDISAGIYERGYNNLYGQQLDARQADQRNQLDAYNLGTNAYSQVTGNLLKNQDLTQAAQSENLQAQLGSEQIGATTRGQGLDAYMKALYASPELMQMQQLPADMLMQLGQMQQAQGQAEINANMEKFNFNRDAEWNRTLQYLSALQAQGGGIQTSTMPNATTSAWQGALSGAAMGYGLQRDYQNSRPAAPAQQPYQNNQLYNGTTTNDLFIYGNA